MKPINTVALLSIVLAMCSGCLSVSHFESWNGPQEFEGEGGAFTLRDGIEVYSAGTPKKRCRVIGVHLRGFVVDIKVVEGSQKEGREWHHTRR
jgi:hypothetical protein